MIEHALQAPTAHPYLRLLSLRIVLMLSPPSLPSTFRERPLPVNIGESVVRNKGCELPSAPARAAQVPLGPASGSLSSLPVPVARRPRRGVPPDCECQVVDADRDCRDCPCGVLCPESTQRSAPGALRLALLLTPGTRAPWSGQVRLITPPKSTEQSQWTNEPELELELRIRARDELQLAVALADRAASPTPVALAIVGSL
jgi:hypothetical protein